MAGTLFGIWFFIQIFFMGPADPLENLKLLQQFTQGAAFVFSFDLIRNSINSLLDFTVFGGAIIPIIVYNFLQALRKDREGQRWSVPLILIMVNLSWYILASIGWMRYAFGGLALTTIYAAKFFLDLLKIELPANPSWGNKVPIRYLEAPARALRIGIVGWLLAMIILPLSQTALQIISPPFNAPEAMAAYMDGQVPKDALVETWEPEMGFLTDHNYHFPHR